SREGGDHVVAPVAEGIPGAGASTAGAVAGADDPAASLPQRLRTNAASACFISSSESAPDQLDSVARRHLIPSSRDPSKRARACQPASSLDFLARRWSFRSRSSICFVFCAYSSLVAWVSRSNCWTASSRARSYCAWSDSLSTLYFAASCLFAALYSFS